MIWLALIGCGGGGSELDGLGFLEGYWRAEDARGLTEEAWKREGDVLRGEGRFTPAGASAPASTESLRIAVEDGAITYFANPGAGEVPFAMTSLEGTTVVFENPAHDFPQRIAYTVDGEAMTAAISGPVDGETREIAWRFTRGVAAR